MRILIQVLPCPPALLASMASTTSSNCEAQRPVLVVNNQCWAQEQCIGIYARWGSWQPSDYRPIRKVDLSATTYCALATPQLRYRVLRRTELSISTNAGHEDSLAGHVAEEHMLGGDGATGNMSLLGRSACTKSDLIAGHAGEIVLVHMKTREVAQQYSGHMEDSVIKIVCSWNLGQSGLLDGVSPGCSNLGVLGKSYVSSKRGDEKQNIGTPEESLKVY
jgi:hypothetical protein